MFNYIMDNPFVILDPINKYELFKKLIQNKDKKFLIAIQELINIRICELKQNNN